MEDAEAWTEPAEEAIQGVLQQQGVSRVGQQMQVQMKELLLLLLPDPPGHEIDWGRTNTHTNRDIENLT